MAIIELEKVSYAYGKSKSARNEAIGDVSFKIEEGEYVGVIGHTGSGKSTLIKHLNCILKPTGGKIYINGVDVWKDKTTVARNRQNVGLVFQYPEYQLFEETVEKDIAFGPKNLGLSADEVRFRVARAIEMVGLSSSLLGKNPFELSGGEKRRVAIAGILAMDPKILVFDEPTVGLDPAGKEISPAGDRNERYRDGRPGAFFSGQPWQEAIERIYSYLLISGIRQKPIDIVD